MKRPHRTVHARLWLVLAWVLPVVFLWVMALKQTEPNNRPAVLLEAPSDTGGQQ